MPALLIQSGAIMLNEGGLFLDTNGIDCCCEDQQMECSSEAECLAACGNQLLIDIDMIFDCDLGGGPMVCNGIELDLVPDEVDQTCVYRRVFPPFCGSPVNPLTIAVGCFETAGMVHLFITADASIGQARFDRPISDCLGYLGTWTDPVISLLMCDGLNVSGTATISLP